MWVLIFLMAFRKSGVNRPITVSFNTHQQRDTKARQGYSTSPADRPPVRPGNCAAAPTSLVDGEDEAMDDLVKRISKAKMRVSIKSMLFQM